MEINDRNLREFRADFQEAVKALERKYGVVIEAKSITYEPNKFHFKVEVNNGSSKEDVQRINFNKYCKDYYMQPEDYGKEFQNQGKTYRVIDIAPSKKKYPIVIQDVNSGKQYGCTIEYVPWLKERKDAWYLRTRDNIILNRNAGKVTHLCKYCGKVTDGEDTDLLCPDCQRTFGHTFYSEL